MDLLVPQLLNRLDLPDLQPISTLTYTDLAIPLPDNYDPDKTMREISMMLKSISTLLQLADETTNRNISQASLQYLDSAKELTDNKILVTKTDPKGVTILAISQEGIVSVVNGVFHWIINTLRQLWNMVVNFIQWLVSKNVRYQYAIKHIQSKIALSGGVMLPLNNRTTVLSYSDFYLIEGMAKNIIAWSKTLSALDMAHKIKNDATMFRNGQFYEPSFPYLEATLSTKGWTKVNAVGALANALALLRQTDEPRALERKVLASIAELEKMAIKIRDNHVLTDAERNIKLAELRAQVEDCKVAVYAVTKLEGMIRKLATTSISVGRNLVPIGK